MSIHLQFLEIFGISLGFCMHVFVIPGDSREIGRSVRASLLDAEIREPPGRSGRVGNYGQISISCICKNSVTNIFLQDCVFERGKT